MSFYPDHEEHMQYCLASFNPSEPYIVHSSSVAHDFCNYLKEHGYPDAKLFIFDNQTEVIVNDSSSKTIFRKLVVDKVLDLRSQIDFYETLFNSI